MSDAEFEWNDDDFFDQENDNSEEEEEEEKGDNIASFGAYRDMGAEGRMGGVMDEDLELNIMDNPFATNNIKLDPKTKFTLQFLDVIKEYEGVFRFTETDLKTMKQTIHTLSFIHLKNALAFVFGYYLFKSTFSAVNVNVVKKYIQPGNTVVGMTQVIKYARFWENMLST
jgi:hypothetical protein